MGFGKKGKDNNILYFIIIGVVALQVLGYVDFLQMLGINQAAPTPQPNQPTQPGLYAMCPTDGDTTLKLNVRNYLNTTASEEFDVTAYVFDSSGAMVTSITDTVDPSGVTVNCGDTYTIKAVAADGVNGDNSKFVGKDYGDVTINADGSATFVADRSTVDLGVRGVQHAVLQFKLYDNDEAGWMCDSDDACTSYEADGTTFESTTNGSAKSVASGGLLDITFNVQGTGTDTDFADAYTLVLIEGGASALTIWNDPNSVTWNGQALTEYSASLNTEEAKQFSGYEWVYRIDGPIEDNVNQFRLQMAPNAGQDPTADMEVDWAEAGNYLSIDGKSIKTGAAKDDTSYTVTYTLQDVTLNLS